MAPKKKATATAPDLREPGRMVNSAKAHLPTRAVRRAINKQKNLEAVESAKRVVATVMDKGLKDGAAVVAADRRKRPPIKVLGQTIGRPRLYPHVEWTDELGEDLFVLIATGHTMGSIAKMDSMPSQYQMIKWLADETHPFCSVRTRAKAALVPYYEDLIKDVAFTENKCTLVVRRQVLNRDGDIVDVVDEREMDNVERSKLAVQGLQWTLSHLAPRKHGPKPDLADIAKNEQLEGLFASLKAGPAQ